MLWGQGEDRDSPVSDSGTLLPCMIIIIIVTQALMQIKHYCRSFSVWLRISTSTAPVRSGPDTEAVFLM